MKVAAIVLLLVAAMFAAAVAISTGAQQPKVTIPGVNAPDETPNGCVDCHKKSGSKDFTLQKVMTQIMKGKHVKVTGLVKEVPTDCAKCHKKDAKVGELDRLIHKAHLTSDDFLGEYQGGCTSCHALNKETYQMSVKSAKL